MRGFLVSVVMVVGMGFLGCSQKAVDVEQSITRAPEGVQTMAYRCRTGQTLIVRSSGQTAWLYLQDKTIELRHDAAASGVRYSDGDMLYWSKGQEALFEIDDDKYRCTNDPRLALWEAARLDGYDLRAAGNEPLWSLLLKGDQMTYVGDDGATRVDFSDVKMRRDRMSARSVYQARGPKHAVILSLESTPCQDSIDGTHYDTTAKLILDGKKLEGCAKALK